MCAENGLEEQESDEVGKGRRARGRGDNARYLDVLGEAIKSHHCVRTARLVMRNMKENEERAKKRRENGSTMRGMEGYPGRVKSR